MVDHTPCLMMIIPCVLTARYLESLSLIMFYMVHTHSHWQLQLHTYGVHNTIC